MTKLQNASLTRLQALVVFLKLADIVATIASFSKLKGKVADFIAAVTKIETTLTLSSKITKDTTGNTKARNLDISAAVKLFKAMLKVGKSWGEKSDVKDVQSLFSLKSTAFKTTQLNKIALLENALDVIKKNQALITGNTDLKDATITALATAITKAISHKGELQNEKAENKAKTKELKTLFSEAQKALTSMTDSVEGLFAPDLPDANEKLYDTYTTLSQLAITTRPTGIKILFLDGENNNKPLADVLFAIDGTTKSITSGPDGYATLLKLRAKKGVSITCSLEKYETLTKTVDVERGKVLSLTLVLIKG